MTVSNRIRARLDSWFQVLGGLGGPSGGAARTQYDFVGARPLPDDTLEQLYLGDPYAACIAEVVPDEALRQGFRFVCEDPAIAGRVTKRLDALHARAHLVEAWTWARVFGGGALLVGARDGAEDTSLPLDPTAIASLDFLTVLDKRDLTVRTYYDDPRSPNLGQPEVYALNRQAGDTTQVAAVHATRLIRFDGVKTTARFRRANGGWSASELQRVYSTLMRFNAAFDAMGVLLQDASQGVFKIKDLFAMMAADTQDAFKQRLAMMDYARSAARSIIVDAETEDFTRVEANVSGLPDVIDKFILLLAGAAKIPVTILMGQSPAGLNATGDSDIRWFYDRVRSAQMNYLRPRLERLIRLVLLAKNGPTNGVEPHGWSIEFAALYQLDPLQEAQRRYQVAQTDAAYITAGVLTADEVAVSRYRGDGWNPETSIDIGTRRALMSADLDATAADPADTAATTQLNASAPAPTNAPRPQRAIAPPHPNATPTLPAPPPPRGLYRPAMAARLNDAGAIAVWWSDATAVEREDARLNLPAMDAPTSAAWVAHMQGAQHAALAHTGGKFNHTYQAHVARAGAQFFAAHGHAAHAAALEDSARKADTRAAKAGESGGAGAGQNHDPDNGRFNSADAVVAFDALEAERVAALAALADAAGDEEPTP